MPRQKEDDQETPARLRVGQALHDARVAAGKTGQGAARHLDVHRDSILKWELGTNSIPLLKAARLARLYGLTLDELMSEVWELLPAAEETAEATLVAALPKPRKKAPSKGRGRK